MHRGLTAFDRTRYLWLCTEAETECVATSARRAETRAEILLHPMFANRIYVKGMLVQSSRNKYGVNLKAYEMQSRDRQNTIPPHVLSEQIFQAWLDATTSTTELGSEQSGVYCHVKNSAAEVGKF